MKVTVVGAPAYFARRPAPRTPDDLAHHSCIQYRWGDGAFVWPFQRNGQSRRISVRGPITVNSPGLAVRAAVDGLGVAYTILPPAEPFIRSGQLVRVLGDWLPPYEGYFLYYPGHRQVPSALRALIDILRTGREQPKSTRVIEPLLAEMTQSEIDKKHLAHHAGAPTTRRRTAAV
jgi:DNA-binding transcriptional LysR family regulator